MTDWPEKITVDGHMYVHVAACPCDQMVRATAKHAQDIHPRDIGYTASECERDMRRFTDGKRGCSDAWDHPV